MFLFVLAAFFTDESLQAAVQNQHLKDLLFSTAGTLNISFIILQVSHFFAEDVSHNELNRSGCCVIL